MKFFAQHKLAIFCALALAVVAGAYLLYDKSRTKSGKKSLTPWLHDQANVNTGTAVIALDSLSVDQQAAVKQIATKESIQAERNRNEAVVGGALMASLNHE